MTQIKVLWSALGRPTKPGQYRYGLYSFDVTLGDIERAEGYPDAVFTAIHPDFYPREAPFLLTYVEFPSRAIFAAEPQPSY
jgi:hypothetical protein